MTQNIMVNVSGSQGYIKRNWFGSFKKQILLHNQNTIKAWWCSKDIFTKDQYSESINANN